MDREESAALVNLKERIVAKFGYSEWQEVGLLSGWSDRINGHSRLLRSLSFGDEDYAGNVLQVMLEMYEADKGAFQALLNYVDDRWPDDKEVFVSAKVKQRKITFSPDVFTLPELDPEDDLVSVMMSFDNIHLAVFGAIQAACTSRSLKCKRADDVWEETVLVQDIFELIFRSRVVISDFTGKNPNVMYETGIAHTLGKTVIPIAQSVDDVPFDLRHHRCLIYRPDRTGLAELTESLKRKFATMSLGSATW
jgi:hypothetical protein